MQGAVTDRGRGSGPKTVSFLRPDTGIYVRSAALSSMPCLFRLWSAAQVDIIRQTTIKDVVLAVTDISNADIQDDPFIFNGKSHKRCHTLCYFYLN